jgi:hypothetical protein
MKDLPRSLIAWWCLGCRRGGSRNIKNLEIATAREHRRLAPMTCSSRVGAHAARL